MTSKPPQYAIEPLDPKKHDRESFECKEPALDEFIRKRARKEVASRSSTCFVIVDRSMESKILGFYTLSSATVPLSSIPSDIQRKLKLAQYPQAPVTLLGRIAKHNDSEGTPIGKLLMANAIKRCINSSHEIGSTTIILDPKNEKLRSYYHSLGFLNLSNSQMIMPMRDAQEFLKQYLIG